MNAPFNARLATSPDVFASVLGPDAASRDSYRRAMMQAVDVALENAHVHDRPYAGNRLEDLMGLVDSIEPFPDTGLGTTAIIDEVGRLAVRHALAVSHPRAVAHLHCPVAVPALAAEALISVTNQSLDSWDQSPLRRWSRSVWCGGSLPKPDWARRQAAVLQAGPASPT